ncbi:DeoR/GlpR family DNA-binding transcription regulator [Algibacillus agarilyticus]|uniref:DeoR/GlpR family DNA-binding transcription regulator n=1 Tax=Algibacillus agarilyticus TaxID=2234133 RepID=UPI000DD09EAE|nr:DeoR family transcriptional regulator [Algibacillus agarilyticus]
MIKRNTEERRSNIVNLIAEQGEVSVDQLASRFKISEVTIRKDLAELEKKRYLMRRHGGAIAIPNASTPQNDIISSRKQAIALAAENYIKDHSRIIIDSGKTTSALIPRLASKEGLVVMTNSLDVANQLRLLNNAPALLMTGGTWDPSSQSFQGQAAENVLRAYDFDQLFIGADSIDIERGTTTFNELIGLSRVMAEVSREVIVVAESDKIGRKIPNVELTWQQINILITDDDLPNSVKQKLIAKGVNVICAPHLN